MAKLIYSAFTSLDGYVADESGSSLGRHVHGHTLAGESPVLSARI